MPFRQAHEVVGRLVRACVERGLRLDSLTAAQIRELVPEAALGATPDLTVEGSVASRNVVGGTARDAVAAQMRLARTALDR
jgi:argininosuccinate lyase